MADTKFSQFTNITSYLGTDVLVGLHSTLNAQGTVSQLLTYINANAQITESQVTNLISHLAAKLDLSGGTMTGNLILNGPPTVDLQAADKKYVDDTKASINLQTAYNNSSPKSINLDTGTPFYFANNSGVPKQLFSDSSVSFLTSLSVSVDGLTGLEIGDTSDNASTFLQVISTQFGTVPFPGMTNAQGNAIDLTSAPTGLGFYDTTYKALVLYDGADLQSVLTANKVSGTGTVTVSVDPGDPSKIIVFGSGGGGGVTAALGSFVINDNTTALGNTSSYLPILGGIHFSPVDGNNFTPQQITISGISTPVLIYTDTPIQFFTFNATASFKNVGPAIQNTYSMRVYIYKNGGSIVATNFKNEITLIGLNETHEITLDGTVELSTGDGIFFQTAVGTNVNVCITQMTAAIANIAGSIVNTDALPQAADNLYLTINGGITYQNISGSLTPGNFVLSNTAGGQLIDAGSSPSTFIAAKATLVNTTASSTNANLFIPFVGSSSSGYQALDINANLQYNPSAGLLTLQNITLTAPSASQLIGLNSGNNIVAIGAGTSTQVLHGNASGLPTYSALNLATDVTGTLANGNTTATSANTASTIVARDSSGNFSAGTITAALSGNASTVTNGVYTTGSYSDPSWITALAGSKITGLSCCTSFATVNTSSASLSANTFTWVTYAGGQCTLTLPNGPADNTVCCVQGVTGASIAGFKINAQGSDKIQMGSSVGAAAGSLTSTPMSATDGVTLIYKSSATAWVVPNTGLNMTVA